MKRTEMKRTPMRSKSRPKSAGDFTLAIKGIIYDRDSGRCFRCGSGIPWGEGNIQHRQARLCSTSHFCGLRLRRSELRFEVL